MTDELLMRAVRDGDLAGLGVLFERHAARLFEFLSRMTGDRTAAEDLVQDVFVRMLKYRSTFRDEGSFETWMFRIARNARADYFSKRRPETPMTDEHFDTPAPADVAEADRAGDTAILRRALLRLDDDRRELIVLARYRGLTHEQIAGMLGIQPGAVKVRIHRAMKALRAIVQHLSHENQPCDAKTSNTSLRTT